MPLDGPSNVQEAHSMTEDNNPVTAKALYKCPHCGRSSMAKITTKVNYQITLHRDLSETTEYILEDVKVELVK